MTSTVVQRIARESYFSRMPYVSLGPVNVGHVGRGTIEENCKKLADRARQLGGNAVIDVALWTYCGRFSWLTLTPAMSGKVIRTENPGVLDVHPPPAGWY